MGTISEIFQVSSTLTPPPQMTQLTTNGTFTIPAGTPPGTYLFYYQICSSGFCTGTIECRIQIDRTFIANADTVTAAASGAITYNVLSNDVYRGTCSSTSIVPATTGSGGNVTLTQVAPFNSYFSILSTGFITLNQLNTPAGTYILNYNLCDNLFPAICQTVSVQINVPSLKMSNNNTNSKIFDIQKTVVAPNPSNGIFTVYFNTLIEEANIELYTLVGQKVFEKVLKNTSEELLLLNRMASGTYLLKISTNKKSIMKLIII
ncbi:T9SS type A sorting domain-containing protein, partial [Flavobacterium sp.]|uniref:T9SS type A sorting domain-containing protein n=1 Tax=Flavobacterium sp. TaxID=239 RepID=UPI00391A76DA